MVLPSLWSMGRERREEHALQALPVMAIESIQPQLDCPRVSANPERPEDQVPVGQNGAVVRIRLFALPAVMHPVHGRRHQDRKKPAVEEAWKANVGMVEANEGK